MVFIDKFTGFSVQIHGFHFCLSFDLFLSVDVITWVLGVRISCSRRGILLFDYELVYSFPCV